jgi:hypothetical protein
VDAQIFIAADFKTCFHILQHGPVACEASQVPIFRRQIANFWLVPRRIVKAAPSRARKKPENPGFSWGHAENSARGHFPHRWA